MNINKQIVNLIEQRLEHGQKTYGQEVQDNDPRDFLQEALEEALDGCVYLAAQIIKMQKHQERKLASCIRYLEQSSEYPYSNEGPRNLGG